MKPVQWKDRSAINSLILTFSGVISTILTFSTSAYAARMLGADAIGQYYWCLYLVSYVTLLCGLGMSTIGQREIAKLPLLTSRITSLVVSLQLSFAALGVVGLTTWSFWQGRSSSESLLLAVLGVNVMFATMRPTWVLQAHQRMTVAPLVALSIEAVQALLVVILVSDSHDLFRYAWVSVGALAAKTIFEWCYLSSLRIVKASTLRFASRGWKALIKASIPVAISKGAIVVYYNIDALIVGAFYDSRQVGYYSTAYTLMLALTVPCISVLISYEPILARAFRQDRAKATAVAQRFLSLLSWIGFPLAGAAFLWGEYAFIAIYGSEFAEGAAYFKWLTLNIALVYVNVGLANPLISWGFQKQHMNITVASAVLNVILNFALLPYLHVYGAILATIISELFVFIFVAHYRKKHSICWFPVRPVLLMPLGYTLIVCAFLLPMLPGGVLGRAATVLAGSIIVAVARLTRQIDPAEAPG